MYKLLSYFLALLFFFFLFSCKSAKLSDAVEKEEKGEYYDAAQIYRRVYQKTSPKKTILRGTIAFHMAECNRKVNNPQRAASAYQNAIRYHYPDSTTVFHAAKMNHKLAKYADAKKQYHAYLEIVPDDSLALNGIVGCDSALVWKKNPTRYVVKRMDKFNSREGEFSPVLFGENYDQIIFNSSRKDATGDEKSGITGAKNNDFFLIKQDEKGAWTKPQIIEGAINTDFDEGAASFSTDGSTMYYTYCSEDEKYPRTAEIRSSSRSGAQWSAGQRLEIFKDSLVMAAHPSVGADNYLYFVSDRLGGYGGKDIWRIPIGQIGSTFPENLGPEINTAGDETFPCMRTDGILFFSSDGHAGMGGLDIFKATPQGQAQWKVENMKHPINSNGDDFGITFEGIREKGFFSSNRNDGRGADHLYSFEYPETYLRVEGWVLDKEDYEIENASVRIVGKDGSDKRIFARRDGTYTMDVLAGMEYVMLGTAPGYLNQKQSLFVPIQEESETFYVDFHLPSISKPVLIENIFYDFDRATLRPESKEALDEIITMLEDNPNVTIELLAHTDRKGSEEYNINLSQRRAQSVVDYLIRGGIEKERLTPAGYGKLRPKEISKRMATQYDFLEEGQILSEELINTLPPEQQEIADQINRRTEFKVLRTNYRLF